MKNKLLLFIIFSLLLIGTCFWAIQSGSLQLSFSELIQGTSEKATIVKDLRLPRIVLAILAGAALSVAGLLFQAVLRNPLADAGIIGISAGAQFFSLAILLFFPKFYFWTPLFAFIGGSIACLLVFSFSYSSGLKPLQLIVTGVAINAIFSGLNEIFANQITQVSSQIAGKSIGFGMKSWGDVRFLFVYVAIGLALAFFSARWCNLLALSDKNLTSLGLSLNKTRIIIAGIAVLLTAITTAIVGVIAFIGLLVPHIARGLLKTSDYRLLIPFSSLLGALILLVADTLGRSIFQMMEIPAATVMMLIGGPCLIFLLWKGGKMDGNQ